MLESIRSAVTVVCKDQILNFVDEDCQRKIHLKCYLLRIADGKNEQLYVIRFSRSNNDEFLFETEQQSHRGEL